MHEASRQDQATAVFMAVLIAAGVLSTMAHTLSFTFHMNLLSPLALLCIIVLPVLAGVVSYIVMRKL